ncbi:MAG: phage tail tube protein [Alistipes sp.]
MTTGKTGYVHGSDLLLLIDEEALGHSKSCEIQNQAETKQRATKETSNTGRWNDKSVIALSVSISAEGFSFYGDKLGYEALLKKWEKGEPVVAKYAHRGEEATTYRTGKFTITSLTETAPADDDATYSISLENCGEVKTVDVAPVAPVV